MKNTFFLILLLSHIGILNAQFLQMGADIDGEAGDDRFGAAVALDLDGSRLVVGGTFNGGNGPASGHVRVFDWNGTSWNQVGVDINGEAAGDESGEAVAISGDGSRIVIGSLKNAAVGVDGGHARVYEWDGANWNQLGVDLDAEGAGDQFGVSVSISADGSRIAIGGNGNDLITGVNTNYGHVRVFDWDGANWNLVGAEIIGESPGDASGGAVSLSSDGTRVAIGALGNDGPGGAFNKAGHTRIYEWSGVSWVQVGVDLDGNVAADQAGVFCKHEFRWNKSCHRCYWR